MRNEKKISYITYQTFPAETANSLQTISNIKYLSRNGFNVELVFPLRSINSSDDLNIIRFEELSIICLLENSNI